MGTGDGVEEAHVGGVGDDALVEHRIVGQLAVGPHPHVLLRLELGSRTIQAVGPDIAGVDRPRTRVPVAEYLGVLGIAGLEVGERLGVGETLGRLELMLEALFGGVERGREMEDGVTMLDGDDAAGRERSTVADPFDFVEDRDGRVAGTQEVGMQRVDGAVLDRSSGGDERLACHLATEHALALFVGALATEDVLLDLLEVEQADEVVDRSLWHSSIVEVEAAQATLIGGTIGRVVSSGAI